MELFQSPVASQQLVLFLLLWTTSGVISSCPPNSLQIASQCVAGLGLGQLKTGSPNEFIQEGDGGKAAKACANGDLLDAVNCVERVQADCKHDNSDWAHFLRQMFDVDRARQAVKYFCTNIATYVSKADCIASHHNDQETCAEEAFHVFKTQHTATNSMDSQIRFQCIFISKAINCTNHVLTRHCGTDAAEIVTTVMQGIEPPICVKLRSEGVQARKTSNEPGYDVSQSGDTGANTNENGRNTSTRIHTYIVLLLLVIIPVLNGRT